MALQDQNIPVSFSKGLNTKTDPKQTMQGSLLSLANGVFTKVNAINQDPGYLPLPQSIYNTAATPESISLGNSLSTFNGQLILTDSTFLYNFSETTRSWIQTSPKFATSISSTPVGSNSIGTSSIGIAKHPATGLEFYTYYQLSQSNIGATAGQLFTDGIYATILDPVNSTILYSNVLLDANLANTSGFPPFTTYSAVIANNFFSIYSTITSGGVIQIRYMPVSVMSPPQNLTSVLLLTLTGASQPQFFIAQSTTNIYVLYQTTTNLVLASYTGAGGVMTLVTSTNVANVVVAPGITRDPATGNIIVTYALAGVITAVVYSAALAIISGPLGTGTSISPQIYHTTSVVNTGVVYVYAQQDSVNNVSTGYYDVSLWPFNYPTLAPQGLFETIFGVYISSNAYVLNNKPTINVGFFDFTTAGVILLNQSNYFTIAQSPTPQPDTNFKPNILYTQIAKYAEGTAGAPLAPAVSGGYPTAPPSQVLSLSNTQCIIPYLNNANVEIDANVTINQYNITRLNQVFGTKTRTVNLGNNLNMTGGVLSIYDGVGIAESLYHVFPWQTTSVFTSELVVGTAPPSLTPGDAYAYVFTYEWIDNYGNLHRSAPSAVTSSFAAAADASHISQAVIKVNGTSLSEGYKIHNIQIVLWRTTGNGNIFFRIASQPNPAAQPNVVSPQGFVTFTDARPDSSIQDSTQLYTTGGEVDNIGPPATDIIFPYKNRLIAVESDNPYVWWYSKQVIQGFPVEFSDLFTANIDMTGGPISAGSTMDDKLIFFKDSAMFYVIGDGPAPNGTSNDFSYPQVITSDVGCTNQDSIVVIPNGLMFQSTDKGIYLLDRNLQVSYIGAAVEQFNNIPVTSAALLPNTTQVRFTLNNGTILIYDYAVQQWSTHINLTFVDSTIYRSLHVGLQANGQVLEQTQGQWIDITSPAPLSLTTGWFEFASLQGYQRVKELLLLLTSVNATSILVQVYMDFDTTAINNDLIVIPANTVRQQYRIFPAFQKGQSMQITITEVPTGAQAGGLLLSGLSFIAGVKKGNNKVSGDRNYG